MMADDAIQPAAMRSVSWFQERRLSHRCSTPNQGSSKGASQNQFFSNLLLLHESVFIKIADWLIADLLVDAVGGRVGQIGE